MPFSKKCLFFRVVKLCRFYGLCLEDRVDFSEKRTLIQNCFHLHYNGRIVCQSAWRTIAVHLQSRIPATVCCFIVGTRIEAPRRNPDRQVSLQTAQTAKSAGGVAAAAAAAATTTTTATVSHGTCRPTIHRDVAATTGAFSSCSWSRKMQADKK